MNHTNGSRPFVHLLIKVWKTELSLTFFFFFFLVKSAGRLIELSYSPALTLAA